MNGKRFTLHFTLKSKVEATIYQFLSQKITMKTNVFTSIAVVLVLAACTASLESELAKGNDALKNGKPEEAVIHYKNAVAADPNSLTARKAIAEFYKSTGDFASWEEQLKRQRDLGDKSPETLRQYAALLIDRGDYKTLIKEVPAAELGNQPEQEDTRAMLALALAFSQQNKEATEILGESKGTLANISRFVLGRVGIGSAKTPGDYKTTIALFETVKKQYLSDSQPSWYTAKNMARVALNLGDIELTKSAYLKSIELLPSHAGTEAEYAGLLVMAGDLSGAKKSLEKLTKIAPKGAFTLALASVFDAQDGKVEAAYTKASAALAAAPSLPLAVMVASNIEASRGMTSTARARLQGLLSNQPAHLAALRLLAKIDAREGKNSEALSNLEKAFKLAPDNPRVAIELAAQKITTGSVNEAKLLLTKAAQSKSDDGLAKAVLADLELRQGNQAAATKLVADAISAEPSDTEILDPLLRLAARLRNLDLSKKVIALKAKKNPDSAEVLYLQSALELQAGNKEKANALVSQSLAKQSDYFGALMALKRKAVESGDLKEYEAQITKAITEKTPDARIYQEALALMRVRKEPLKNIADAATAQVALKPDSATIRYSAANLLRADNRKVEAQKIIDDALALKPRPPEMTELGARWAEENGDNAVAIERYAELAKEFPYNGRWPLKQAQIFAKQPDYEGAIKNYQRAISLNPEIDGPKRELALLFQKAGRKADAINEANALEKLPGRAPLALLTRADIYFLDNNFSLAEKEIETAVKQYPSPATFLALVRFHEMRKNAPESEKSLQRWAKQFPNSADPLLYGASRAEKANDSVGFLNLTEKALKLKPNDPFLLNNLAYAQLTLNKPDALKNAEMAAKILPDNTAILDTLALAQLKAGQKEAAETTLKSALEINPDFTEATLSMAVLKSETGKKDEAKRLIASIDSTKLSPASRVKMEELSKKL